MIVSVCEIKAGIELNLFLIGQQEITENKKIKEPSDEIK